MFAHDVAHSVPALLSIDNPVEFDQMERVFKDQASQFKTDFILAWLAKFFCSSHSISMT
jgi:hypothetical protein